MEISFGSLTVTLNRPSKRAERSNKGTGDSSTLQLVRMFRAIELATLSNNI